MAIDSTITPLIPLLSGFIAGAFAIVVASYNISHARREKKRELLTQRLEKLSDFLIEFASDVLSLESLQNLTAGALEEIKMREFAQARIEKSAQIRMLASLYFPSLVGFAERLDKAATSITFQHGEVAHFKNLSQRDRVERVRAGFHQGHEIISHFLGKIVDDLSSLTDPSKKRHK